MDASIYTALNAEGFLPSDRRILHADCNAYFASVESLEHPEWKKVPLAVCGDPKSRHGVILAKNDLAKVYGIKTAETVYSAKRKCPSLLLVPPHMEKYWEICERINAIYQSYTDLVERFSVDESFLDVTGTMHLFGSGKDIADQLRKRVQEEIGITVSVGVSYNKTFAKMGSDYKKPDATTVINRENYRSLLWPLPVQEFLFVGKASGEVLNRHGIVTVGDLAATDEGVLTSLLGKAGAALKNNAMGNDPSPVKRADETETPKSVGNGVTFPRDLLAREEILSGLLLLCDQVGTRLRQQKLYALAVQVQIKDPGLKVISRQKRLPFPSYSTKVLRDTAMEVVDKEWPSGAPIRMLTVTAINLVEQGAEQLGLFEDRQQTDKQQRLESTLDSIRTRYGSDAMKYARVMDKFKPKR